MSQSLWCAARIEMGPIALPGQQQAQLRVVLFPVPDGQIPENVAAATGLMPFAYIRPATEAEAAMHYELHPEKREDDEVEVG